MSKVSDNQIQQVIRVALVDDDPFVRASLFTILSAHADIEVVGEGGNGKEGQEIFNLFKPDVLLMDIQMPQCDGIEAARNILSSKPDAKIIFLTTFSDDEYIVSALRLGVKGYLIKQEVANIAPAIRAVYADQMVLGGEVLGRVDALVTGAVAPDKIRESRNYLAHEKNLSEREVQIVELIAQGLDNKEIAAQLYMGEGTVRNHVSTILQKLDLKNRTQIAVFYYRH